MAQHPLKPVPLNKSVSSRMRLQKSRDTLPEMRLVDELRRRRFRVLSHPESLPGTPDIVLPASGLVIFAHGCFWHGCPKHFVPPKHNRAWWNQKIANNRLRDRRKAAHLRRLGWSVMTVREHTPTTKGADRVQRHARSLGRSQRFIPKTLDL